MNSKFLHGERLSKTIVRVLQGKRRDLAVAFIGKDALERLGLSNSDRTRVICDLWSGGCNPGAVRELHIAGYKIKNLRNLHAKVYLGDRAAVIGSANLSSNGFGDPEAPQQWGLEAGVLVDQPSELTEIASWFEAQFASASDFDPADSRLDEAWKRRPARLKLVGDRITNCGLLRQAIVDPDAFDSVGFVFTNNENKKEAVKAAIDREKALEPERGKEIERLKSGAFTAWDAQSVRSWPGEFIAYHLGARGGFSANALRLERRNEKVGDVLASKDWPGIAGRVIPGITQTSVESLDRKIVEEINDVIEDGCRSFRSARALSNWYYEKIGRDGIAYSN